jgi:NADPH:quinone reductase-like Zn-dependent oxidoreductase
MRAAIIAQQSPNVSAQVRVVDDWPEPPAPGPGQVTLQTLASALNHLDLWVGRGIPGLRLIYPRIGGSDACARVVALGAGVDPAWLNTRVMLNAATPAPEAPSPEGWPIPDAPSYELLGEHHHGAHCERFNAPLANLQPAPADRHDSECAAFGLTFLTAWSMIVSKAQLRSGQHVLVTGIGGGVACASLSIATALGARVCVTSRHQSKLDRARELGAHQTILDNGDDWSRRARELTHGRGFDLAVDSTGKATHLKCIKSLARGGTYVTPGCTAGPDAVTDLARVFWNQLRIIGSTMGDNREFAAASALYRAGKLRPLVDRVYKANDAAQAYARLEAGEQMGKVVIDWT